MTISEEAGKISAFANTITHGHAIILVVLAALAAAGGTYAIWRHSVYMEGYNECKSEDAQAKLAYDAKVDAAHQETERVRAEGQAAVLAAQAARPSAVTSARRLAQAAPTFAAVQRPPELAAQRTRELAAIAKAAKGSEP